jgi:sugar phosphate isomerase/epimerase
VPGRSLGTMITLGYPGLDIHYELDLAHRLGASVLEILPQWRDFPDPAPLRSAAADRGLLVHSAHGCWGGQAIKASRVDLGSTDTSTHRESIEDLERCVDWLAAAGGTCLVVHPGGLSFPADQAARRESLARGLLELADHARGSGVIICVENMPPGVFPGSRMAELFDLLRELAVPGLALALDTGHAHISAELGTETLAAGSLLATTHVHDNDGRSDSHEPPGRGTIDWNGWAVALDQIDYRGPIMLECVRRLRADPASFCPEVLAPLLERRTAP